MNLLSSIALSLLHIQCTLLFYSWRLCSICMSRSMLMETSKAPISSLDSIHLTSMRCSTSPYTVLGLHGMQILCPPEHACTVNTLTFECMPQCACTCAISNLQVYLVDYGLAYRYRPQGQQKEYKEDPRRKHDGTLEFTSIDAHKGVSECIF